MGKTRLTIPKKVRDHVLGEFNHRCAVCGADKPHLHHIDEDPSNNEPLNLVPLCPNCHLTDQHNPTARLEPERLKLFRAHRDPAILRPEFQPLFKRLQFFEDIRDSDKARELEARAEELCNFVAALTMGEFYKKQIERLTKRPSHVYAVPFGGSPAHDALVEKHRRQYIEQLREVKENAYSLAVELLRYQNWRSPTG